MKWLDLSLLEDLYYHISFNLRLRKYYPNPAERKKVKKEMHKKARALLDDAIRREAWAAGYENRPQRSISEVASELKEQIKNGNL